MKEIKGSFDSVFFTESTFRSFLIEDDRIVIEASDAYLLRDHPRFRDLPPSGHMPLCTVNFAGVASSKRSIVKYIGDQYNPRGYEPEKSIDDGPFPKAEGKVISFEFEGLLLEPLAWVSEWKIQANEFWIKVD